MSVKPEAVWTGLGSLVAIALGSALAGGPPRVAPDTLVLAGLAVVLEAISPRTHKTAFLSLSLPLYPALALRGGFQMLVVTALIGLGLRTLRPPRELQATLHSLFPIVLGGLVVALGQGGGLPPESQLLVALAVQMAVDWMLNGRYEDGRVSPASRPVQAGLGAVAGILMQVQPMAALALVPFLGLPWFLLRPGLDKTEVMQRHVATLQLELEQRTRELSLMLELSDELAVSSGLQDVRGVLLKMALQVAPSRSGVVFSQRLRPVLFDSPEADRLREYELLGLKDSAVEKAWAEGRVVAGHPDQQSERMLPNESYSLAFPLSRSGVLYLGRNQPFTAMQLQLLRLLTQQAGIALDSARQFRRNQRSLQRVRKARKRLHVWVFRLSQLLDGCRRIASALDREALEQALPAALRPLLPQHRAVLRCFKPLDVSIPQDLDGLGEFVQVVRENQTAILLDPVEGTRFHNLVMGWGSLMGIPLTAEGQADGVLVVGSSEPGGLKRSHQDLLEVLALQLSTTLRNIALYQEVVEAEARLLQSSKMAAVGQLAAGVAHELNTPLGVVKLGLSQSLRFLDEKPARARTLLTQGMEALEYAQTIISKLLHYSREGRLEQRQVDLVQVVEDGLVFVAHTLDLDRVQLEKDLQPVPPVRGNPTELQQVVVNLVLNARDAMVHGESSRLAVRVSTRCEQGRVRLEVRDFGPGLTEEVQARMFEPFYTTKPVGKGTGLGLYIISRIATQHGGSLKASNCPDGGALFVLELPAGQA